MFRKQDLHREEAYSGMHASLGEMVSREKGEENETRGGAKEI